MALSSAMKTGFATSENYLHKLCIAICSLMLMGCHMVQSDYSDDHEKLIPCGKQRLSIQSINGAEQKRIDILDVVGALIDIRQAEIYNGQASLRVFSQNKNERKRFGGQFIERFFDLSVEESQKCLLEGITDSTSFASFNFKADEILYFGYARYEGKKISRYLVTVAAQI